MDIQEAIEYCKEVARKNRKNNVRNSIVIPNHWISSAHCAEEHEQLAKWLEELQEYKQLGTIEEIREAVEKQEAKKPIEDRHHGIRYTEVYRCPSCNGSFSGRGFAKYCFHCGQAIDWSEDE